MRDAVLVADKSRAQDVKAVVDTLRKAEVGPGRRLPALSPALGLVRDAVPGDRFQVKRIMVKPGGVLSACRAITTVPSTGSWWPAPPR
jgi:mannose-1-phosphate guanylyltransferase/mannose-6-phosphate isomerase